MLKVCKISLLKRKKNFKQTSNKQKKNQLKECIDKPNDLWKAIKLLRLSSKSGGSIVDALTENQTGKMFIQTWQEIYWQKFQSCQIDIQVILSLIIIKNLHYLKISSTAQHLKIAYISY